MINVNINRLQNWKYSPNKISPNKKCGIINDFFWEILHIYKFNSADKIGYKIKFTYMPTDKFLEDTYVIGSNEEILYYINADVQRITKEGLAYPLI